MTGALAVMLSVAAPAQAWDPAPADAAVLRVRAYGPSFPTMKDPPVDEDGRMSPVVQQAIGCIATGVGGAVAAVGAGSLNLLQTIAGGAVVASNVGTMAVALGGVVFMSYCAIGAAVTPLVVYMVNPPPVDAPAPPSVEPAPAEPPPGPMARLDRSGAAVFRAGVLTKVLDRARAAR